MTPSAYTPWPEGRPPHMIQTDPHLSVDHHLDKVIQSHIEHCAECSAWAEEHGSDDRTLWIYPGT